MTRRLVAPIAGAFIMMLTLPAFGAGPGGGGAGPSHGAPPPGAGDISNRGGAVRGLDRADQVAGEHGDKGRDNAEIRSNKGGKQRGHNRANEVAGQHGDQSRDRSETK
jgi:hypothetical protein